MDQAVTDPAAAAPGRLFRASVGEYVFMTEWCGLSPEDAARAMGRSARVVERYRACLRAFPQIREEALAPYQGGETDADNSD